MGIELGRRQFLAISSAAGAMLVFVPSAAFAAAGGQIGHYVRIGADNSVTIRTATTEIGQGTNTSIPMLIVEELDYPFDKILVENFTPRITRNEKGETNVDAFAEGAGGSTAVWDAYDGARQAGAKVRRLLMEEAASRWGVPVEQVTTNAGRILRTGSNDSFAYGDLAEAAARRPLPTSDLSLKPRSAQRLIGTPQRQKAARAIVTGEPLFGMDQRLPGMLYAVVLRAPVLGAEIASVDDSAARAMPGVRKVVHVKGAGKGSLRNKPLADGVAVVADTYWQAVKARDALKVAWTAGAAGENSDERFEAAYRTLTEGKGKRIKDKGDVAVAFASAAKQLEARYETPLAAHAPMEPQNTIAHVTADGVRIVTPTQQPVSCAVTAADVLGIPVERVDVTPVRCGGGFGRRLYTDMIVEAVLIAREVNAPVKLVWTRECDMTTDFFRPGGVHQLRAALGSDGLPVGWIHNVASASRRMGADLPLEQRASSEVFPDDHPGCLVPNLRIDFALIDTTAIRGAWRAPGHNNNAFVMQAFLDECAEAAGFDPLEYRLALLGSPRDVPYDGHGGPVMNTGRMAGVLRKAAEQAGWGQALPAGRGRGIAAHFSFGSYVAHVVDVTMKSGGIFSVDRVVSAIDCGIAVNPNGIRMQNEGAINDALSTALGQAITIRNGQVEQRNFDRYEMMRIDRAATNIETHIIESDMPPRGMGEPAFPPFAAALANALYAASGKRIRKLPIAAQLT